MGLHMLEQLEYSSFGTFYEAKLEEINLRHC